MLLAMLLKVNLVKQKEKEVTRSLEEIEAQEKELAAEKKQALKAHKKDAIAEVKKLIVEYKLTKGDIRGKAIKQLMGDKIKLTLANTFRISSSREPISVTEFWEVSRCCFWHTNVISLEKNVVVFS